MTNGLESPSSKPRSVSRKKTKPEPSQTPESTPPAASVVEPKPDAASVPESVTPPAIERDDQLLGSIESVLLTVDRPVSGLRLAEALGLIELSGDDDAAADLAEADEPAPEQTAKRRGKAATPAKPTPLAVIKQAVATLNQEYQATGRAFRIEAVAGGYRLMTLPHFADVIENFLGKRERTALSRPAVETLAIIAYKQPITRAQLEAVRGVACGEVLKTLVERRLVTITGRAEELGRPMLYGTTRPFLEAFGLSSLKDLPSIEEFRARHSGGDE